MTAFHRLRDAVVVHAVAVDVAVALALAALVLQEILLGEGVTTPMELALPVALAMTLPLVARRRFPVAVALVVLGAWALQGIADDSRQPPQTVLVAAAAAMWALGRYATSFHWALAAALALVIAQEPGDFVVLGPLMGGVAAGGRLMRRLEDDTAERERAAAAEERARVARELHDVVAHSISLIVLQAGAERLAVAGERPQTAEALERIERTAREALAEMRRLLEMLRRSEAEERLAPQPGLARVPALLEEVRRAGLAVELAVEGEAVELPAGVDISAYRIVQEGLTNALRHAGATHARVRIAYARDELVLAVADDGRGGQAGGAGHGLRGMRERVAVFGGRLDAGGAPGGGWTLEARLPL